MAENETAEWLKIQRAKTELQLKEVDPGEEAYAKMDNLQRQSLRNEMRPLRRRLDEIAERLELMRLRK